MTTGRRVGARVRAFVACGLLGMGTAMWNPACAQVHKQRFDDYLVRANVLSADTLSAADARRYGIDRDPDVGILDLVVLHGAEDTSPTATAHVSAWVKALSGVEVPISMRPIVDNDRVSYLGTFVIPGRGAQLSFRVSVRPERTNETLRMAFRDSMGILKPR